MIIFINKNPKQNKERLPTRVMGCLKIYRCVHTCIWQLYLSLYILKRVMINRVMRISLLPQYNTYLCLWLSTKFRRELSIISLLSHICCVDPVDIVYKITFSPFNHHKDVIHSSLFGIPNFNPLPFQAEGVLSLPASVRLSVRPSLCP